VGRGGFDAVSHSRYVIVMLRVRNSLTDLAIVAAVVPSIFFPSLIPVVNNKVCLERSCGVDKARGHCRVMSV
jgi:hypothetical protein